jgi:uncharacterized protein HemX
MLSLDNVPDKLSNYTKKQVKRAQSVSFMRALQYFLPTPGHIYGQVSFKKVQVKETSCMNKAAGCILLIGILIVGIALYGMKTVSANQMNTNTVFQNADVMPARPAATAAGQGDLNKQNQKQDNLKNSQVQETNNINKKPGNITSVPDSPPRQQTSNVNPAPPVPAYPFYVATPGTTGGKPGNTGAGSPEQQPDVNNAPQTYYGYWDRDGCW